ncbi:hypothetical protein [Methylotenera sp. N17]|uniref:hypothetical protein n=1 Tax=Methylotenera sp. N17 TaxID=1502761 RepID=UPI000690BD9D|nr:hypothetical protein [Methylotenera sp. N17]
MGSSHSKQTKALGLKDKMSGPRIWLPLDVLFGKAYASLSITAKALLIDLAAQIRSRYGEITNNGDLTTALRVLSKRGWRSDKTIRKAAKELEGALLIVKTRQGHLPNKANLYAVTWLALNESPKFDFTKIGFPYKGYLKFES